MPPAPSEGLSDRGGAEVGNCGLQGDWVYTARSVMAASLETRRRPGIVSCVPKSRRPLVGEVSWRGWRRRVSLGNAEPVSTYSVTPAIVGWQSA